MVHLINGPKALDRGVQEACVSGVTQSPSRWLWRGICYHFFSVSREGRDSAASFRAGSRRVLVPSLEEPPHIVPHIVR